MVLSVISYQFLAVGRFNDLNFPVSGRVMFRTSSIIGFLLVGLILSGCASSPWSAGRKNNRTSASPISDKSTPATTAAPSANAQNPQGASANSQANAQAMQQIMEELRQLGTLDPAAQNKLMEDLKQTDPALWPLVMQQFRAAIAYKRRAAEREATAASSNSVIDGKLSGSVNPSTGGKQPADQVIRLPASTEPAVTSSQPPKENSPAASEPPAVLQGVQNAVEMRPAKETANAVVSVSYNEPISHEPDNGQGELSAAIKAMEASAPSNPKTSEELAQQARLRMLYMLAGRRDDALKPIPSAPPAMQEFWSKELYGLATLLDSEKTPDTTRRAAESKQIFCEAITRLGETAPLVVRNLTFCTAIQSYGCFTPFKKYEFTTDQEALLYAEMDNFAAESTAKGFHTQLRSSYQILDSTGQRVADHTFTTTEEYCQNSRRDFFIGYHLRMPKRINPGKYTLQITVEDLKSQKVGQSSIEFTIKEAEK
jgi:hypothetical protein